MKHLEKQKPSLIALFIFWGVFGVYMASPVTTSTDSKWTFHVAASILQEGNVNLDEYRSLMTDVSHDYHFVLVGDHVYSFYPTATPLIAVPFTWAVNKLYPWLYPIDFYTYLAKNPPGYRTANIEKFIASGIVALCAVMMFLIARQFLSQGFSVVVAIIFALATSMWSTASRALWQHGPSALCLSISLYLFILARNKPRLIPYTGVLLAIAYLIRPTNSLSIAFLSLYVLVNFRKQFFSYIAVLASILGLFVIHSWTTYGSWLPPYSVQLSQRLTTPLGFLDALGGTLISPGRGLFIFSSFLLFFIYGIILIIKRNGLSLQHIDIYLIGVILTHWIVISTFDQWDGGMSIGPRYFTDIIPYFIYFLIPVFERFSFMQATWKIAFIVTILVSTVMQAYSSISIYPFTWSAKPEALIEAPWRVWDWTDLQFLRGTCKNNPAEGKAPACWFSNYEQHTD